jgi:hypothetical protein
MEKEFVPYEQALALKELGFDESCFGWHAGENHCNIRQVHSQPNHPDNLYNWCSAPTFSQAFRWFRDTHNMLANVYSNASGFLFEYHDTIGGTHRYDSEFSGPNDGGCWDTYEEAELESIKKLIQIVKEKK